VAEEAPLLRE